MLIPSIDLMGGKVVQLVHGEKKALEFDDFHPWVEKFSKFPLVQLIDLDAAMGNGSNAELVAAICERLPCQVGGGIRTVDRALEMTALGAQRVVIGSALLHDGRVNVDLAKDFFWQLGNERLTFAIDSRGGNVAIEGWKKTTCITPMDMMYMLESYCGAFLYTHIDTEGTMTGFPVEVARELRPATSNQLIVAGGIRSIGEVKMLESLGVDAVVGMAIYTGAINA